MRAIWSGALTFGLVNIPVKLYSATETARLDLDLLDKRDLAPIRYARINKETEAEVPWADVVKGYKREDRYIVIEDADFDAVAAENTHAIEIDRFVHAAEVDPVYYEKPYYLEPDKGGPKAYALLREALRKSGKVGLVQFVLRNRTNLGILEPGEQVLVLNKIRYAEEVRDPGELVLPEAGGVKKPEMDMALQLIDSYTQNFDIDEFHDDYQAKLLQIIEAKAAGEQPKAPKVKVVRGKQQDLMSQLKASLEQKRKAS